MIESIKTALASWLRAEVFALVGEAMTGHDEDRADMLTEIEALKRENRNLHNDVANMHDDVVGARRIADALKGQVETLSNKLADANEEIKALVNDNMPSAQQVADCISRSDLRKVLESMEIGTEIKDTVEGYLDGMDMEDAVKEAVNKKLEDESDTVADAVTVNLLGNDIFLRDIVKVMGSRLAQQGRR